MLQSPPMTAQPSAAAQAVARTADLGALPEALVLEAFGNLEAGRD